MRKRVGDGGYCCGCLRSIWKLSKEFRGVVTQHNLQFSFKHLVATPISRAEFCVG